MHKQIGVQAGPDCVISPFCSLENVVTGSHVRIDDGVQLKNVVIGDDTKISRDVTMYSPNPERPVRIGSHCWISAGVLGEATGGDVRVGDFVVIAYRTTILTSSGPGPRSPILNQIYPVELGSVQVGDHCWVCAHCLLLPKTLLGEGVVVAANAVVTGGDYAGWSVYGGSPARRLKTLDPARVAEAKQRWAQE